MTIQTRTFNATTAPEDWRGEHLIRISRNVEPETEQAAPRPKVETRFSVGAVGVKVAKPRQDRPARRVEIDEDAYREMIMAHDKAVTIAPKAPDRPPAWNGSAGGKASAKRKQAAALRRTAPILAALATRPMTAMELMKETGQTYDALLLRLRWMRERGEKLSTVARRGGTSIYSITDAGRAWLAQWEAKE